MSASALYEGTVWHRRAIAPASSFSYPIWLALLDLAELPEVLERHPLWSARRPRPVRFRRRDFLGPTSLDLADAGRRRFAETGAPAPAGPVRLLAAPRTFGVGFNPVTFLYLHDESGGLGALIAEVTNTPWRDRHSYVLRGGTAGELCSEVPKRLHVSPFHRLDQRYRITASLPAETLSIRISSSEGGNEVFAAGLDLRRGELSRREMSRVMLRYPPPGLAALARIYAHALRLTLGGARRYPRPRPGRPARAST